MTPYDKKSNSAYWDAMEKECEIFFRRILRQYAMSEYPELSEDARIDISKSVLETVITKCRKYGINTDTVFPYIDCNM